MAEGRMLKKEISDSKKLGRLKSDRPRVLWFMMLPHLDRDGRLKADPDQIKGRICTKLPYSIKSIQSALEQLHDVGLITLYNIKEDQCLQYSRFEDFQSFNYDRESESKILPPTPDNSRPTPNNSLLIEEKFKLSKVKRREDKVCFLDFVFLSPDEHQKLIEKFGENVTGEKIKELNDGIGSKGYKYKSHYHTILTWDRRDKKNGNTRTKNIKNSAQRKNARRDSFAEQDSEYGETIES